MLGPVSAPRARAGPAARERADLWRWFAVVGVGLGVAGLAVAIGARLDTAAAPFTGSYRFHLSTGTALAPAVAILVLIAVRRGAHRRLGWRTLLTVSYLAGAGWALALALADGTAGLSAPVSDPDEYLADLSAVGDNPVGFVEHFTARSPEYTVATRQHPPLPVLLLWAASRVGVHDPVTLGVLITLIGALTVPLVAVAVASLAGESAGRDLLPVLVLAPYAVWIAVSMDAISTALGAGLVAAGVLASERDRSRTWRLGWAMVSGVLLGVAALFSYSVAWLGVSVICVYFVRRRPLLNVVSGVSALTPLAVLAVAGFSWTGGLRAVRGDMSAHVWPTHDALAWAVLGLVVLAVVGGPALAASARKVRRTPAWPFLVGAALGVGFAVLAGLARGETERSWLPFFPWLLVAAVAPEIPGRQPTAAPVMLAGVGALTGVVLQAVLRTAW